MNDQQEFEFGDRAPSGLNLSRPQFCVDVWDVGGDVVKDNDTYLLKDNTFLKNLVVSSTTLRPGKRTNGHHHFGQEEVYYFISGKGRMYMIHDDVHVYDFNVGPGDVVQIPDGWFHQVHNLHPEQDLHFVCVFQGQRGHS